MSRSSDNFFQFGFQEWQVFADRGPNNIQINFEVSMDQTITHSTDIQPGDGTVLGAEFGRYFARRLADNLKLFNQRKNQHAIPVQVSAPHSLDKLQRLRRCIQHMLESYPIMALHIERLPWK